MTAVLASVPLTGAPVTATTAEPLPGATLAAGIAGVSVGARSVDGVEHTVVQVLLDDDRPDFDHDLYRALVVADVVASAGDVVARELMDHDDFRRALRDEQRRGQPVRRGVLVTTGGELPDPWVRLAFLPVPLAATGGTTLELRRSTPSELVAAVEAAVAAATMSEAEAAAARTSIEHLRPQDR